jgi:hypothetical protein
MYAYGAVRTGRERPARDARGDGGERADGELVDGHVRGHGPACVRVLCVIWLGGLE